MHKVLDLFSGIGGFSLGLERTGGFETVAFCECCPKAQKVLNKHWASVPIYNDIKDLTNEKLQASGIVPTVICGGFPCTDISTASSGKQTGIVGSRSGLWEEMLRLVKNVRPKWVLAENVSALRSQGLTLVLQNLCEIGYMCEFHTIPASYLGAPHHRSRIWIIARCNSNKNREPVMSFYDEAQGVQEHSSFNFWKGGTAVESAVVGVANGVSRRLDRLRMIGNSLVPQIPEMIGNAILEHEKTD